MVKKKSWDRVWTEDEIQHVGRKIPCSACPDGHWTAPEYFVKKERDRLLSLGRNDQKQEENETEWKPTKGWKPDFSKWKLFYRGISPDEQTSKRSPVVLVTVAIFSFSVALVYFARKNDRQNRRNCLPAAAEII